MCMVVSVVMVVVVVVCVVLVVDDVVVVVLAVVYVVVNGCCGCRLRHFIGLEHVISCCIKGSKQPCPLSSTTFG